MWQFEANSDIPWRCVEASIQLPDQAIMTLNPLHTIVGIGRHTMALNVSGQASEKHSECRSRLIRCINVLFVLIMYGIMRLLRIT